MFAGVWYGQIREAHNWRCKKRKMIRGFTALLCENLQPGRAVLASRGICFSYPSNEDKAVGRSAHPSNLPHGIKHTFLRHGFRVKKTFKAIKDHLRNLWTPSKKFLHFWRKNEGNSFNSFKNFLHFFFEGEKWRKWRRMVTLIEKLDTANCQLMVDTCSKPSASHISFEQVLYKSFVLLVGFTTLLLRYILQNFVSISSLVKTFLRILIAPGSRNALGFSLV